MRWLYSWFDPAGAQEATEALIAEGSDVFAFTEDTPTVIQTAAESGYPSYSHYASMLEFSPDTVVSGQIVKWETIYIDVLQKIHDGVYTSENLEDLDYFSLLDDDAVEVGAERGMPINPVFEEDLRAVTVTDPVLGEISVYDLVLERIEQMTESGREVFDPFMGRRRRPPGSSPRGGSPSRHRARCPGRGRRSGRLPERTPGLVAAPNVVGPWDGEP